MTSLNETIPTKIKVKGTRRLALTLVMGRAVLSTQTRMRVPIRTMMKTTGGFDPGQGV